MSAGVALILVGGALLIVTLAVFLGQKLGRHGRIEEEAKERTERVALIRKRLSEREAEAKQKSVRVHLKIEEEADEEIAEGVSKEAIAKLHRKTVEPWPPNEIED